MNPIGKFIITLSFVIMACIIVGCNNQENQSANVKSKNIIVLVKYKAQPDKGDVAVSELNQLIEQVKTEPYFIKIKVHVDLKDNTNILLYEKWGSESYYNTDHMNTAHLKQFITNSRNFLAGPPEISQWSVEKTFK